MRFCKPILMLAPFPTPVIAPVLREPPLFEILIEFPSPKLFTFPEFKLPFPNLFISIT